MRAPNMARVIFSQGSRSVRVRRSTGAYIKGRWEVHGDHDELIRAAVRPLSPSDRKLLPEGMRTEDSIALLTRQPLRIEQSQANGGAAPDRVLVDGWWWKVIGEKAWGPSGFWRSIAVRQDKAREKP